MAERQLFLGGVTDPATHERTGERLHLPLDDLTTHGVIVGMTGSGKTGLAVALLEEALLQGTPTLVLDPKGDMANLLLGFPELSPEQFAPWVPSGADPDQVAATWREGLAGWGLEGARIAELHQRAALRVYTPGSTAAAPLNIIGSLAVPDTADAEVRRDEAEGVVAALLGLLGIEADPLSSREHILLANLVIRAWDEGRPLELAQLIAQVQEPPMRRLGVIDVDAFFPRPARTELALRLNGLLASPSFAAWADGEPLDIGAVLGVGGDRPAAAVIYLAHLSDDERQFVVTLVLSKLVTWMRSRPGSPQLQVLVYMDEVYGFVPPVANPPAKRPLLTLFKQARAYGVGVVVATQNPVDLDYKAIANAGTWLIGRLQTERDKARLLDGMGSAGGEVDLAAIDATVSGLDKREFVLHQAGRRPPLVLTSRWTMSYLAGPLTREQLRRLPRTDGRPGSTAPPDGSGPPATGGPAQAPAVGADAADVVTGRRAAGSTAHGASAGRHAADVAATGDGTFAGGALDPPVTLGDDQTTVPPAPAEGIAVRFVDPAAPWLARVGGSPEGRRWSAAAVIRASLLFDDDRLGLRHSEEWEAVLHPLGDPGVLDGLVEVDHDERDLRTEPPPGAVYVMPRAKLATKTFWSRTESAVKAHLHRHEHLDLLVNRELGLASRPGESEAEFRVRCHAAAEEAEDAAADELRAQLAQRAVRLRDQLDTARDRLLELEGSAADRARHELISGAGELLGSLLGGRRSARSLARAVRGASSRRSQSTRSTARVDRARRQVEDKTEDLAQLEDELAARLVELDDEWSRRAEAIEPLGVPLEKADIAVHDVRLAWIPIT